MRTGIRILWLCVGLVKQYSSTDDYPIKNMGKVFVHGRIYPQGHGQVFLHGRVPSEKHGQAVVRGPVTSFLERRANTQSLMFQYSTNFKCKL